MTAPKRARPSRAAIRRYVYGIAADLLVADYGQSWYDQFPDLDEAAAEELAPLVQEVAEEVAGELRARAKRGPRRERG